MSEYNRMFKDASFVNSPIRARKMSNGNGCDQIIPKKAGVVGEKNGKCNKCYNNLGDLIY